jgi:hypothetical protein
MPGNLEALPILPEHAYEVKRKSGRNPYPTRVSGSATCHPRATSCHQAGGKGAEGGAADP